MNLRFRRRGWSLLEVTAVISVSALLMMTVALTLNTMLGLGQQTSDRIAWQSTWHRLALEFHDDVHAAREAEMTDGGKSLKLTLAPREQIVYRAGGASVERERLDGQAIAASESYLLPTSYAVEMSLSDGEQGQLATIALSRASDEEAAGEHHAAQPLRVEALVARDQRLATLVNSSEDP